jgi:hypothetical protein
VDQGSAVEDGHRKVEVHVQTSSARDAEGAHLGATELAATVTGACVGGGTGVQVKIAVLNGDQHWCVGRDLALAAVRVDCLQAILSDGKLHVVMVVVMTKAKEEDGNQGIRHVVSSE